MGFDDGEVIFDRENNTYYAGQMVHGKLVFNQGKVKTFRSIYLEMAGFCQIHWETKHTRRVNDRTEHYTKQHDSEETYYEQTVYLIGTKNGECKLNPGRHEFPFQCLIPPHCPSSFEHSNGFIRYEFKFVVDRAFKFDQEKVETINVIAQKDLNADPSCKEPIEFDFHESYCCWCISAGICDIEVSLPQSGFCPGQTIPITVNCANNSNVKIDKITFKLTEEITFTATDEPDTRTESDILAKIVKGPVPENTTRNWVIDMEVPLMDLYNVDGCDFIDIDYEFEVKISTSGCHKGTSASCDVILGHIPLREFENDAPMIIQPVTAPLQQYPSGFPINTHQSPGANAPYDGNPPYPVGNLPYPGGNPTYPGGNPPYPGGNPPFPGGNPPYPGGNLPYPGGNPPYPGGNPLYPGGNPPYSGAIPPYTEANSSPNSAFQGSNPPNPEGNSCVNPMYTGGNPPFSHVSPPYPGVNPPYPVITPYNNVVQQSSSPSDRPSGFTMPTLPGDKGPHLLSSAPSDQPTGFNMPPLPGDNGPHLLSSAPSDQPTGFNMPPLPGDNGPHLLSSAPSDQPTGFNMPPLPGDNGPHLLSSAPSDQPTGFNMPPLPGDKGPHLLSSAPSDQPTGFNMPPLPGDNGPHLLSSAPSDQPTGFNMPPLPGDKGPHLPNSPTTVPIIMPTAPVPPTPGCENKLYLEQQPAFNPEFNEEKK